MLSPSLLSLAIGCATMAVAAFTLAQLRHTTWPAPRTLIASALAGAMLLAGPFIAVLTHTHLADGSSLTLSLALVPVVVAVARPAFRHTEGAEVAGRLWPGIAAVAGLLLIVPEPSFAGVRDDVLLVAAPLATGIGAAWFRTRHGAELPRAGAAFSGATLVFLAGTYFHPPSLWSVRALAPAALADAVLAGLSVTALLRLGGTRWSAQFELVPLAVLLEGLFLVGFKPDPRASVGLLLILLASVFLLLPPRLDDKPDELVPRS